MAVRLGGRRGTAGGRDGPSSGGGALFNVLVLSALNLFNVFEIGESAYLGSFLAGIWSSGSCCRTSP